MILKENNSPRLTLALLSLAALVSLLFAIGCSKPSVSEESASYMSYDAAFTQDYTTALQAAQMRAEDVKLLGIRSDDFTLPGSKTSWIFLFYSWDRCSAYTVTVTNGKAKVRDNPGLSMLRSSFDTILDLSQIAYDADDAYAAVLRCVEGTGKLITCRAYIAAYVGEDEGGVPAGKWVFNFNDPQDVRNAAIDKTGEISPQRYFIVDAFTGDVSELALM